MLEVKEMTKCSRSSSMRERERERERAKDNRIREISYEERGGKNEAEKKLKGRDETRSRV